MPEEQQRERRENSGGTMPRHEQMPEAGTARAFVRQTRDFNREAAREEIIATMEEAGRLLDRQAAVVRQSISDMRTNGVHEVESVVRSLLWMIPKLGIDQMLVLVAQYNRNFQED